MPEYLLEVRSRELPPELQRRGVEQLARRLFEELMGRGVGPAELDTASTPRRLAVVARGLPETSRAGLATRDVLAELVPLILAGVAWGSPRLRGELRLPRWGPTRPERTTPPAELRWGGGRRGWARPVLSILSLYDGQVLPLAAFGVDAGDETAGHPVLSPAVFRVKDAADYGRRLRRLGIEPVYARRRDALRGALAAAAKGAGGELRDEERLLRRVAARCEVPGVVAGAFDPAYLSLPPELLIAALAEREEAFVTWKDGRILPTFLAVVDRRDDPDGAVRRGLETAVAGELADCRYHLDEDRRTTLAERRRRLDPVAFHDELGTWAEKAARTRALAELLCEALDAPGDAAAAGEAVELAKADLTTSMVREHPELRGVVGGIYARAEGYVEPVWRAVYEQYRPRGPEDAIPAGRVGRVVALADRLDTLVGFAGIGRLPGPGGRDPLRLRPLADGLLRILVEAELAVDLDLVAARAVLLWGERLGRGGEEILADLQALLRERLRLLLGRRGSTYDEVEAAMAVGFTSLPELVARVAALATARAEPSFRMLVNAAKRLAKIVDPFPELALRPELLREHAERELHAVYVELRPEVEELAASGRHAECLAAMAGIVPNLDRFFSVVLVMDADDELRRNRIALLQAIRRVFWKIARLKDLAAPPPPAPAA